MWTASSIGLAAVATLWLAAHEQGLGVAELLDDAVGTAFFVGPLVVLPALVGGAVGSMLRHA